jgi:hypothetical protein
VASPKIHLVSGQAQNRIEDCSVPHVFGTRSKESAEIQIAERWLRIAADPLLSAEVAVTGGCAS